MLGSFRVRGGARLGCQCARARAQSRVSRRPAPPPRPRARAASPVRVAAAAAAAAEIGIRLLALGEGGRRDERGGRREEGGQEGRLGLRRVHPRETRIVRPRQGRPGRGRCKPRAEAERGPCRVPAARRARSAVLRGLEDEFPGVQVSWVDRSAYARGERPARAPGEFSEGAGRVREALAPGVCQAAADWAPAPCAPAPGPSPPRPPAPWTPDVGPWRPPCLPAPFVPHPRVSGRVWGGGVGESRLQGRFLNP